MSTLQELRTKAGLTQLELADAAGLSVSTIQKLEYGDFLPSWATVQSLANVLGPSVLEVSFTPRRPLKKRGRKPKSTASPQEGSE